MEALSLNDLLERAMHSFIDLPEIGPPIDQMSGYQYDLWNGPKPVCHCVPVDVPDVALLSRVCWAHSMSESHRELLWSN